MPPCSLVQFIESSSKWLVTRTCTEDCRGFDFWRTFRLLALEFLSPGQLHSYLRTIQKISITLLAGSKVSDRWPLGYLFI